MKCRKEKLWSLEDTEPSSFMTCTGDWLDEYKTSSIIIYYDHHNTNLNHEELRQQPCPVEATTSTKVQKTPNAHNFSLQ